MSDLTITNVFFDAAIAQLRDVARRTVNVAQRQTDGLAHEDTLVQLPFRANCMNWILGHIISTRGVMLRELNAEPVFTEDENAIYVSGSAPITDGTNALRLETLMEKLASANERLNLALDHTTLEHLLEIVNEEKGTTRLAKLQGLAWHEAYHIGQLEHLRQAAGKDDHIF
ncbi:MAG: DinB family protein [Aggregatilineales bacterium]